MPNKKMIKIVLMVILIGTAVFLALMLDFETVTPTGWPASIKTYHNPITGKVRVADANTGATIFSYYDDPAVYPVNIEKLGNDQWKVTFARR